MRFEDFLINELGSVKEDSVGELRFCCPFCGEQKYKFYVKVTLDDDNGLYHCKKCNRKGNPITFVKEYYNLNSGKQAKDILDSKGIRVELRPDEQFLNKGLTDNERMLLALKGAQDTKETVKPTQPPLLPYGYKYLKDNYDNPESYPYFNYLYGRGITDRQIQEHMIAYIPNGYFYNRKKKPLPLKTSIIFFTFDNQGNYVYWNTRNIDTSNSIKSINAPANPHEFSRKEVVFNLNKARFQKIVVLNEGVFDALTFGDMGIATFGKQVTDRQIELIHENIPQTTPIFVFLDTGATNETINSAKRLYAKHKLTYVVPHGEEDANDMGFEKSMKVINQNYMLATPENLNRFFIKESLI